MFKICGISFSGSISVLCTQKISKISKDQWDTNQSTWALALGSLAFALLPVDLLEILLALVGAPCAFRKLSLACVMCPWLIYCGLGNAEMFYFYVIEYFCFLFYGFWV